MKHWERVTAWPLGASAVVFLIAYSWPILDLGLPRWLVVTCHVLVWFTWALFAVDAVVRFALNKNRKRYLAIHLFDLAIIVLSLWRPLKLLRLATMIRFLNRRASRSLRGRLVIYAAAGCALLLFCGSLAILDAERGSPQGNIKNFGDAIWWATETITTVGYGDHYPTTGTGRLVAVAVMVGGITLLGLITATLAAWLVQQVTDGERDATAELEGQVKALTQRVETLTSVIERDRRERSEQARRTRERESAH